MKFFLKKAKAREADIDKFLDTIGETAEAFEQGIAEYLEEEIKEMKRNMSQQIHVSLIREYFDMTPILLFAGQLKKNRS